MPLPNPRLGGQTGFHAKGEIARHGGAMSSQDLGLWVAIAAILAQIVQTYFAVRQGRQAPTPSMRKRNATKAAATLQPQGLSKSVLFKMAVLSLVAWAAVLFG